MWCSSWSSPPWGPGKGLQGSAWCQGRDLEGRAGLPRVRTVSALYHPGSWTLLPGPAVLSRTQMMLLHLFHIGNVLLSAHISDWMWTRSRFTIWAANFPTSKFPWINKYKINTYEWETHAQGWGGEMILIKVGSVYIFLIFSFGGRKWKWASLLFLWL